MLDALIPAIAALEQGGDCATAARAAREGAEATARMTKAQAGRSSYLAETTLQGVADPGAVAIAAAFDAAASVLGAARDEPRVVKRARLLRRQAGPGPSAKMRLHCLSINVSLNSSAAIPIADAARKRRD